MKCLTLATLLGSLFVAVAGVAARAQSLGHEDALNQITKRLLATASAEQLQRATPDGVMAMLTPDERDLLAKDHIRFNLSHAATVTVLRPAVAESATFWLAERGFKPADVSVEVNDATYEGFERSFDAGEVSLGISALDGKTYPYLITVRPLDDGVSLAVSNVVPSKLKVGVMSLGAKPLIDRDVTVTRLSQRLEGQQMLRTSRSHGRDAALLARFRNTPAPSSASPDHLTLTMPGDPQTSVAVQWRTSTATASGVVAYRKRDEPTAVNLVHAKTTALRTPEIVNDGSIHLHAARLDRLQPATRYDYCVGDSFEGPWTSWSEFVTAPPTKAPFKFVYLGDAQVGFEAWGGLLHTAHNRHPDAAFYLLAGDLVDRGHDRDDWDGLFANATGVLDQRPIVPVIGNHEVLRGKPPSLYRGFFDLPRNGPASLPPEDAYSFEYGDALFVILDSNADPSLQTEWLDRTLGASERRWKFISFHHPLYPSHPERNNDKLLSAWGPVIDRHEVDMVLQGHDHAYLRTHRMRDDAKVERATGGTYYVVSVSGTKFYEQATRDYTAVGFARTPTYQLIEIDGVGRLRYRAFDAAGVVRDEITIDKTDGP